MLHRQLCKLRNFGQKRCEEERERPPLSFIICEWATDATSYWNYTWQAGQCVNLPPSRGHEILNSGHHVQFLRGVQARFDYMDFISLSFQTRLRAVNCKCYVKTFYDEQRRPNTLQKTTTSSRSLSWTRARLALPLLQSPYQCRSGA